MRPAVAVIGARSLRRDLNAGIPGSAVLVTDVIRDSIDPIVQQSKRNLSPDSQTGRMEDAIRGYAAAASGRVGSRTHEGMGVQHWGGTIAPRGTPIEIEPKMFVSEAIDSESGHVELLLDRGFQQLAARMKFYGT